MRCVNVPLKQYDEMMMMMMMMMIMMMMVMIQHEGGRRIDF